MRILLIKTSSMGDLVHTLPALSDAARALPGIQFDWLVEDGFQDIPNWHPAVDQVFSVSLRRWRKTFFSNATHKEIFALRRLLHERQYDLILDAQGLVKSAWLGWLAQGPRAGLDWRSARESLAALFYQRKYAVNFYQHAVTRMRLLFSQALGYQFTGEPDFNLTVPTSVGNNLAPYLVFLHGTTWASKQWPETYWMTLAKEAQLAGLRVKISGASDVEVARAERIAKACNAVDVMPRLSIADMAQLLSQAHAVVAVDTGFAHLAAALNIPTISIYGSTNPAYTGALGKHSAQLAAKFECSPCLNRECTYKKPSTVVPACYATVPPAMVWEKLASMLAGKLNHL